MISKSSLLSWYDAGKPAERIIAACLIFASFILLVSVAWFSEGSYTGLGGDNMMHYQFSHFSWKHPRLLLDHTAKPLFTLLSSPLAQFGFFGAQLFNILAGITTAWLAYLTLSRLGYKNAYLVIIFVVFAPLYFMMQMTSLTEILFSMLLMLAIYLYFYEHFLLSALVLSFLPFSRTESIIIIPFFALAFILKRKWYALPVLLTGFLLYSFIGMNYHHDFLWYIHQNSPTDGKALYGSGPLLHFVQNTRFIFGLPIAYLMLVGIVSLLWKLAKTNGEERQKALSIIWLIFLPFAAFFTLHSFLWWQGMGGSLGLIRIIAAVVPLCCIIGFIGYDTISKGLAKYRFAPLAFMILISIIIIRNNCVVNNIPVNLELDNKLIKETTEWVKNENYNHKVIYYYDPLISFLLDLDPWDKTTNRQVIWDGIVNDESYADSSLLIWDAHFGPNEGKIPLEAVLNKTNLQLIAAFQPEQPFNVLGGYNYEIYVFRKLPASAAKVDNHMLISQIKFTNAAINKSYPILELGFEPDSTNKNNPNITSEIFHTGGYSYKMGTDDIYSPGASLLISSFNPALTYPLRIQASAYVYLKNKPKSNQAALVISVENQGKSYLYKTIDIGTNVTIGSWTKLSTYLTMQKSISPSDKIQVYLWHMGKDEVILDDLKAEIATMN